MTSADLSIAGSLIRQYVREFVVAIKLYSIAAVAAFAISMISALLGYPLVAQKSPVSEPRSPPPLKPEAIEPNVLFPSEFDERFGSVPIAQLSPSWRREGPERELDEPTSTTPEKAIKLDSVGSGLNVAAERAPPLSAAGVAAPKPAVAGAWASLEVPSIIEQLKDIAGEFKLKPQALAEEPKVGAIVQTSVKTAVIPLRLAPELVSAGFVAQGKNPTGFFIFGSNFVIINEAREVLVVFKR